MATPLQTIYDAFLAKVEADDWMLTEENQELVKEDWRMILDAAIVQFRYPRVSLDYEGDKFSEDLGNDEIQVLANLMKLEWIRRCIATWDNIRQLYNNKEFSQANFLEKLNQTQQKTKEDCRHMLDDYSRSVNYRPNKIFSQLAGK
jgi:hypothetical protein